MDASGGASSGETFTVQETVQAQAALRAVLNLPPVQLPLKSVVVMLSDEMEQLRAAGHD